MMDMILDYETTKEFVQAYGMEEFVRQLEDKYQYQFHNYTMLWMNDNKFPIVLIGENDFIMVGWEGVHDDFQNIDETGKLTVGVHSTATGQCGSIANYDKSDVEQVLVNV